MSQLGRLETSGLIRLAQIEPDLEYLFRHILVQEAAYHSLLAADQKRLHLAVGEAVEQLYADRLDELAAMLARHFERGGDDQHALAYFVRAGDAALATYANEEAENQYRSALALGCSEAQRAELLSGLGEAVYRQSRFDEALDTWGAGIKLYQRLGDLGGVAQLYARSARAAWYADDTPGSLTLCLEGLDAVAGAPESPHLARLMHEAARAYLFNGQTDEAIPLCRQALEMAERLDAVEVEADALTTMGILPDQPSDEVLAGLKRAVALAEGAGLLQIATRAYHNLGVMTGTLLGDQRAAREHYRQATQLAHRRGAVSEEIFSQISVIGHSLSLGEVAVAEASLAEVEELIETLPEPGTASIELQSIRAGLMWVKGEWVESLRLLRLARDLARQRGNLQLWLNCNKELAGLHLELDRTGALEDSELSAPSLDEAEAALEEALEMPGLGFADQVGTRCELSTLRARQGRLEEARRFLVEAEAESSAQPSPWHELSLHYAEAELALAEGRWEGAFGGAEAIVAFLAKHESRWQWARTLVLWAVTHIQRGEPADLQRAQALLREARSAFGEMNSQGYVELCNKYLRSLRSEMYGRAVAHDKISQELAVAGRIQEGLLPEKTPYIPGWQIAVRLEPAREMSGDFYDFIPLPDGRLGIVMADVADKGAGAALYMALSRTLIRTYAEQFPNQPGRTLQSANQRILQETHTDMFVTVFYGVLDAQSGSLLYCNAGHNPPFLLKAGDVETLGRTGLPLGIIEDTTWECGRAQLDRGDALVLYTDGAIDAQTTEGDLFGQERLLEAIQASRRSPEPSAASAQEMEQAVLSAIHDFVGDAARFDDLTLMVVTRARS
ncbi:MAG: SpoIIE family protein phosphatase [Anaerolineae bacterium]